MPSPLKSAFGGGGGARAKKSNTRSITAARLAAVVIVSNGKREHHDAAVAAGAGRLNRGPVAGAADVGHAPVGCRLAVDHVRELRVVEQRAVVEREVQARQKCRRPTPVAWYVLASSDT